MIGTHISGPGTEGLSDAGSLNCTPNAEENVAPIAAVIFDLDGTLLDTLVDLAAAANRMLVRRGLPPHPQERYRRFVGDGPRMLVTRCLPPERRTPETVDACLADFLDDYNRHWDMATRPYAGVPELLERLASRSLPLAVVTNKPENAARCCIQRFFPRDTFRLVLGQRPGRPLKPHPQGAREAAARMGASPAGCLFLGDSGVDMDTARAAGMLPVGAAWGFRGAAELEHHGASVLLDTPIDLLTLPLWQPPFLPTAAPGPPPGGA
jgi:phosphoglycolate phosphatase